MPRHPPASHAAFRHERVGPALFVAVLFVVLPAALSAQASATLEGRVTDPATAEPIASAIVSLPGAGVQTLTAPDGAFRVSGLAPGRHILEVRAIGYAVHRSEVEVAAGAVTGVEVALAVEPVAVEGVRAEVDLRRTDPRMAGFWRRMERSQGTGHFFTREDIEQRGARRLSDMFVGIPQARIVENDQRTGRYVSFRRTQLTGENARDDCPAMLYVDGIATVIGEFGVDLIHLDRVEAIEIYSGSSRVPAEFNRTGSTGVTFAEQVSMRGGDTDFVPMNYRGDARCGVVAVWSRTAPQRR